MDVSSMVSLSTNEKILERMYCTESEKEEIMKTIDLLCEMTETVRQEGYSVLHDNFSLDCIPADIIEKILSCML